MTYSIHKKCATPGCPTRVYNVGIFCAKCFLQTPEGKRQKLVQQQRKRYEVAEAARLARGEPAPAIHCTRCIHWHYGCGLGFPEAVGRFAEDCSVFTVTAIDPEIEALHPDIQQTVQDRLDRAYDLAGRSDPSHPFHSLYTDVFGELSAKGIAF